MLRQLLLLLLYTTISSFRFKSFQKYNHKHIDIKCNLQIEDLPNRLSDLITINYQLLENNQPIDTFFDQNEVTFVVNGSGYLPDIHAFANDITSGQTKIGNINGPIVNKDLIITVPIEYAPEGLNLNDIVQLSNGLKARVSQLTDKDVVIDANAPLAGKKLDITMTCIDRKPISTLKRATFAAGCFWGLELAFQRAKGVVYTAVGYTQGKLENPTYEQVCSGKTGHAEAVTLLYQPEVISYDELLQIFWKRHNPTQLNRQGNDIGTQYRGGIYYYDDEQYQTSLKSIDIEQLRYKDRIVTEVKPSTKFWLGEDYHQQYLEKGGQYSKKSSTETIRCYG